MLVKDLPYVRVESVKEKGNWLYKTVGEKKKKKREREN